MNICRIHLTWFKVCVALILAALLVGIFSQPWLASSLTGSNKISDKNLYQMYFNCERSGQHFCALLYLFAYQMREPSVYLNDGTHNSYIKSEIKRLTGIIDEALALQKQVNKDMRNCSCYPCGYCANTSRVMNSVAPTPGPQIAPPPPDVAVVCEHSEFQGRCNFLYVGTYNTSDQIGLPNDIISSVMVGSKVRLTLYLHGGLTGEFIAFTGNDSNLTDNWIDNTYTWNDNTTSLIVEWR
jgi:hypothetical protein